MEVGRELDILIGEKLFNYEIDQEFDQPSVKALRDQYDEWGMLPFYSTDMNDAMLIVEHLKHVNWRFDWDTDYGSEHRTGWSIVIDGSYLVEFEKTLPLAICLAALKAIE